MTLPFPPREEIARLTARMLLEIKAVHFNAAEPFTYASGLKGPTYIDCRKLISYPRIRTMLMDFLAATVLRDAGFDAFDNIAGGETAGIPFGAWIADRMMAPMAYVRKKPKGFGRNAQIEGDVPEGKKTLLVEDLTTDGGSKIRFAEAMRNAGVVVDDTFVVFFYGVFPGVQEKLKSANLNLHYLATWWDVLEVCRERPYFSEAALKEVRKFLEDPISWSRERGGVASLEEAEEYKKKAG